MTRLDSLISESCCTLFTISVLLVLFLISPVFDLFNNAAHPLHTACERGHLETVDDILQQTLDVNVLDWTMQTAVHRAASQGHLDIVRLLVEHGADVNIAKRFFERGDHRTKSSLQLALENNHDDVASYLVSKGSRVGCIELLSGAKGGSLGMMKLLVEYATDINCCINATCADFVEQWNSKGAKLNCSVVSNLTFRSPLHEAAKMGNKEIVELLLANGNT
jgi:ankyrin repeat protein